MADPALTLQAPPERLLHEVLDGIAELVLEEALHRLVVTLEQRLAARGIPGAPALEQFVVRWPHDQSYRVRLYGVQRSSGTTSFGRGGFGARRGSPGASGAIAVPSAMNSTIVGPDAPAPP